MIRPIACIDAPQVATIYNHYVENSAATFEEETVTPEVMESRIEIVLNSGLPWLVAEENGKIVGYAYAKPWNPRTAYRHTVEVSIYIANGGATKGTGSRLYEALFEQLKAQSIRAVIGVITLPNPASVAIHEKFGMTQVGHFKQVGYKFGQWIDVGYWQALLQE